MSFGVSWRGFYSNIIEDFIAILLIDRFVLPEKIFFYFIQEYANTGQSVRPDEPPDRNRSNVFPEFAGIIDKK